MKEALENCKDPESRLKESAIYANQMFQKKNYKEAAKFYAQSSKTVEEVALKFMEEEQYQALIFYLQNVLEII